jgi:hypothetical protein
LERAVCDGKPANFMASRMRSEIVVMLALYIDA